MKRLSDKARLYARSYERPPYSREIEGTAELLLEMADRLDEYENLGKQGKLLKLPCAVGDTVYEVCEGFIEPCTIEKIFIAEYKDREGNTSYMAEIHYDREDCPYVSREMFFTEIGKTVFLTEVQAEAALKEEVWR